MKRYLLGVAAALCLATGPAAADGLPSKSSIKASDAGVSSWTGFYVGVGVGAGAVTHDLGVNVGDWCYDKCETTRQLFGFDGVGAEGFFGTVSIGYDRQIRSHWVIGVFADYDFGSTISTDVSVAGLGGLSIDQTYTWAIGGRLGYLVNPNTLFYGTAGYTETEFKATLSGGRGPVPLTASLNGRLDLRLAAVQRLLRWRRSGDQAA